MERFRVEVGHEHEVKPGNIVGAIANEAGIESRYIGRIQIFDDHSLIDLPEGMPDETFQHLKRVWVVKRQLGISRVGGAAAPRKGKGAPAGAGKRAERKPLPPRGKPSATHKKASAAHDKPPAAHGKKKARKPKG